MKHSIGTKVLGCTMGASIALGGISALGPGAAIAAEDLNPVQVMQRNAVDYIKVANVSGSFSFCQDTLTPSDEVFNLFGTAATSMCAKPGYAFDAVSHESYYVNIGGKVEKVYTMGLDEIERMEAETEKMRCTCSMSPALAMASVKGVKVSDMLSLVDVDPQVNTITFKDKEGYGLPMPLSYVTEKEALLVYQIGDKKLSEGERLQVWIPDTVAKYFTRAVTDIELSVSDEVPEVKGPDAEYRAKVNVLSTVQDTFRVGDMITFEGYADDCGTQIKAVEFSLDGGQTWSSFDTSSANTEDWVHWHFDYVTEEPGAFKLDVRAVAEDGVVSPLASSVVFNVVE
ncbi:molybdopterin-dependent oxidoreductase [Paraeggerthella hongkongensis]|uniref:Molybdopterin-binding protein n=1 Tax=Paraeggerthella hongkongensis TaxID=230658 RepID=A0A3N0AVG9_9ACTN|nr:molybdopterin-dependent oxidoreductase [Paraeggerthella hongkongensis]RNL38519.1 molybdopterin-binding protein [Paraeggerthella hongkongensis]